MRRARAKQRPMKKLLPHCLKKGRKGECGLFGTNPWPPKRIRGRKKFQNQRRSHLSISISTCLLNHMGMCILWFSLWMGRREGKKAISPRASRNGQISWNMGGGKSKGGLDIQGVFNLLGYLLIIRGATRGNHDVEPRNDQINGSNCKKVKCH